ncbi:acyltransferase family protein [Novosphingobium sp. JCM 18896]|uniref:acyltransferase family protein n=1 Tax=Novosphingobium sp. JCM 18896 TaxID=2989731 RepID=UPI00222302B1|nr:acyltransferase [Novosphingobium sp. JCM 18896]MCW1430169.1 acyltransferase [Novosphingobium sp. JCM 18896]
MQNSLRGEAIIWADVAKCICIILVVLLHMEDHISASGWSRDDDAIAAWHAINMFLRPIRLPMLFLVSGMLSSQSIMNRDSDTIRKYLIKPAYLYFLWGTIFVFLIPLHPDSETISLSLADRMARVLLVASPAWYLLALAGFYCIATVTRRHDLRWLLLICALISIGGSFIEQSTGANVHKLARCLVFFIVGVRLRDNLLAYSAAATPRLLVVSGIFFLGAGTLSAAIDRYLLPVDLMAAAFSLQLAGVIAKHCRGLAQPARWLGQRTLHIYLLHFPLQALLSHAVRYNADPALLDSWLACMLYPLTATLLIVPASLILGEAMQRCGFGWMFDLPRWQTAEPKPATA